MAINDPLGDMLTRIRNAQLRGQSKVATPASSLRKRVLDVLVGEGYIRGYAEVTQAQAKPEFEIELKYFDGKPVSNCSSTTRGKHAKIDGSHLVIRDKTVREQIYEKNPYSFDGNVSGAAGRFDVNEPGPRSVGYFRFSGWHRSRFRDWFRR